MPFFPGAEGYGGTWSGTAPAGGWLSTATVYHVTNLSDSGAGSFRDAFQQNSSNKIIVFDVAGTIQLDNVLDIKNLSNYYIAGQTAPGPVTIYGHTTQITHSNNVVNSNIILRYLTFRRGSAASGNDDTLTIKSSNSSGTGAISTNIIIDHATASWGTDENVSVANNNTNVTVQYSIIADALRDDHAYGSLIRPRIDSSVTYHHNLYANNASRQARFGTYYAKTLTADFRNNVVYNFRDRASYAGGSGEDEQEFANVNYVGNYIIAGPGTGSSSDPDDYGGGQYAFRVDKNITTQVYQSGNYIDPDEAPDVNQPDGVLDGSDTGEAMFVVTTPTTDQSLDFVETPFATAPVTTQTAPAAHQQLVDFVGNWWWKRDSIDERVISNLTNFAGVPLAADAPIESERLAVVNAPQTAHPTDYDADNDGMEDAWEDKHGGNLVWNADFDNDGYINLIEFINEKGEFPAPAPIVFNGSLNDRYAHIMNWKTSDGITDGTNWQPSKYDEAQINSGNVVVDSVGQNAGLLKIASGATDVASLGITAGWLDVHGSLVAGVAGAGTVNQSGGTVIADEVLLGAEAGATGVYNLSDGMLRTASLVRGDGSADFQFTGGVLSADNIGFNVDNRGGMIAPGTSIGQSHFSGNLTLISGIIEVELASANDSDKLIVDGQIVLGGSLNVALLADFSPQEGDSWEIITAGGIDGVLSSVTPGYSVVTQGNSLRLYFGEISNPGLLGDFNGDHVVDAADYVAWRMGFGTLYDEDDYNDWRDHFGETSGGSGGLVAASSAVPEPTSALLLLASSAGLCLVARSRRGRMQRR